MTETRRRMLLGAGVLALLGLARTPLHQATFALPVSNDDAIPLLMASHLLQGEASTILWNQPYNGTLDTYLLAPLLLLLSPHGAFRLYEASCGVLLVVLAGALAARAGGERAAWITAALAAVAPPYVALMAALGPTPNFLVPLLVGALALAGMSSRSWGARATLGWGIVAGLAAWDSMLAVPALCGVGAGLAVRGGWPEARRAAAFAAGTVTGLAPLAVARAVGASSASAVTDLRPQWLWSAGLRDLVRAAAGLFGVQVPLVIDGPERAALPAVAATMLAAALLALVLAAATRRASAPLTLWLLALAAAFAASRRTGGDEVRYLFGLVVPALALCGVTLAALTRRTRAGAAVAALALVVPWLAGHDRLVTAWRDPAHAVRAWQVPPLDPTLAAFDEAGLRSAYASLQFAGRLAIESDGRLRVSQAWNERVPGDPLRFRDEVDLDPRAAWALHPQLSRGMPRSAGFRALLRGLGGRWEETPAGALFLFRAFRPPYDESRPVPAGEFEVRTTAATLLPATVKDRDTASGWTSEEGIARGWGLVVSLRDARPLDALVLVLDLAQDPLAVPWAASLGGEVVAQGPASHGLQWVNGAPRAGRQAALAVPLGGRTADEVRLIFQAAGPRLSVREIFLYGPAEEPRPRNGDAAADRALASAREGRWDDAVAAYEEAVRLDPERAGLHACLLRARWRAAGRRWLDVESLPDGGRPLVDRR